MGITQQTNLKHRQALDDPATFQIEPAQHLSDAEETTLMPLTTNDEHADVRNNIIYTTAAGFRLAMLSESEIMDLRTNWLMDGWVNSHLPYSGSIVDHGTNIEGTDPGFHAFAMQDFSPDPGSSCENTVGRANAASLPDHRPTSQYSRHQRASVRPDAGDPDIDAFEAALLFADGFEMGGSGNWSASQP